VDGSGYAYVTGETSSTDYDVTPGAFQTTNGGGRDVFVTKLNETGDQLVYSTYIGGSEWDYGFGIAVDGDGNAYVTGYTYSTDYPVTAGAAFQPTNEGGQDVFVTKLNETGTALVYSTYIGGSSYEVGYAIAVDGDGNAYVTGYTYSPDYPVTSGAFQTTMEGWMDVFVTKLNAAGTALLYSTYIGGSGGEEGRGIAVDGDGNAYVTGYTDSPDYDFTPGAFQTTLEGWQDVFVTKLNATGTALVYSTYIGGSSWEYGYGIAVDGSGNAYVTGYTNSSDYDVTPGAFQTTYGGGWADVFVTKLDVTGMPVYSTYIGGGSAGMRAAAGAVFGS
jgi:cold shock CspA family protein